MAVLMKKILENSHSNESKRNISYKQGENKMIRKPPYIEVTNETDFVEVLTKVLGIKKGDVINIRTPHFKRSSKENPVTYFPADEKEFDDLKHAPYEVLKTYGIRKFDKIRKGHLKGEILYLYPGEWFHYIPENYEVISLDGKRLNFDSRSFCDDIRYGCLAYGFILLS